MFCKKGVLRNFTKFTRKIHRLWHRCFPVNLVSFTLDVHEIHDIIISNILHNPNRKINMVTISFFIFSENFRSKDHYWTFTFFKINNRNTRKKCEICSKLTIKMPEQHYWWRSGVFIVNFEYISQLFLVFPSLTLSKYLFAGRLCPNNKTV